MDTIKVFVASSKEQDLLVEALTAKLRAALTRAGLQTIVLPWYRESAPPGEDLLAFLFSQCRGSQGVKPEVQPSDFYVVILTGGDKSERDSIFELGLFMAGLDFDSRRCLVLSCIGAEALPEYLRGRVHIDFERPGDLQNLDQCAAAMEGPAEKIRNQMIKLRALTRGSLQVITTSTLLLYERPKPEEGNLGEEAEVLINRAQPVEESPEFAAWVMANMKARIKYRYFFHDEDSFTNISRLIYALATVVPDEKNSRKARAGALATPDLIRDNLQTLREYLSINLLPSKGPLEFCIHNISDSSRATCYLRFPFSENHVKWCENQSAVHIARELTELGIRDEDLERPFVFRSTKSFDIDSPEHESTKRRIWNMLRKRFNDTDLNPLLGEVCFERLTTQQQNSWDSKLLKNLGQSEVNP